MKTIFSKQEPSGTASEGWRGVPSEKTLGLLALAAIVLLAAVLRFADLDALGYANHYYTATVTSMLQSWHNFFFVAAEPGGSVSADKPPVGLWLQAVSAYFLGVNGLGVLLPQILAGILSVMVLFHLVRRSFGTVAGLLAALILAITPVTIAVDRNNTIDSTLILTLLLASWAFIKATETSKLRFLLLGAALVGVGFNIKMLQAYLVLPALYALYFLGSAERLWPKIWKLAVASVLLLGVSLSWAVIVDLTPADQRPYVGSSQNNSELNLILEYNGLDRLLGMAGRNAGSPPNGAPAGGAQPVFGQGGALPQRGPGGTNNGGFPPQGQGGNGGGFLPQGQGGMFDNGGALGNGGPGGNGFSDGGFRDGGGFGGGGGGLNNIGQRGVLRLFVPPLSSQVSWLLSFAIVSALLLIIGIRWRWPIATEHQALVLWGGWLLTGAVFFSVAAFFHEYYLSMLAAPLAALVAIGVVHLWRSGQQRTWLALGLLASTAGVTLGFQLFTAQAFRNNVEWAPVALALFGAGLVLLVVSQAVSRKGRYYALAGFIFVVASLLVTPAVWSYLTTLNFSRNQSLPSAYSGQASPSTGQDGLQLNQSLLDFLEEHTQDTQYLMAVPSSMQGADYVIATGRPVLYLGGFMGNDPVVSAEDLSRMVAQGELRYIYWSGGGGSGFGNRSDISAWVTSSCTAVQGFDTATRNAGTPDGTTMPATGAGDGLGGGGLRNAGGMEAISLYECGS